MSNGRFNRQRTAETCVVPVPVQDGLRLGLQRRLLPLVSESQIYSLLGLNDLGALFFASRALSRAVSCFLSNVQELVCCYPLVESFKEEVSTDSKSSPPNFQGIARCNSLAPLQKAYSR